MSLTPIKSFCFVLYHLEPFLFVTCLPVAVSSAISTFMFRIYIQNEMLKLVQLGKVKMHDKSIALNYNILELFSSIGRIS